MFPNPLISDRADRRFTKCPSAIDNRYSTRSDLSEQQNFFLGEYIKNSLENTAVALNPSYNYPIVETEKISDPIGGESEMIRLAQH